MNKLDRFFAIRLIALTGTALAALPVMAADTTSPAAASDMKSDTTAAPSSDMKSTSTAPAKKAVMSPRQVEEIQAALQSAGVKVDTDGIWGPKTTAAIKEFQKDHGLKVTGHLDHATMAKLNVQRWT